MDGKGCEALGGWQRRSCWVVQARGTSERRTNDLMSEGMKSRQQQQPTGKWGRETENTGVPFVRWFGSYTLETKFRGRRHFGPTAMLPQDEKPLIRLNVVRYMLLTQSVRLRSSLMMSSLSSAEPVPTLKMQGGTLLHGCGSQRANLGEKTTMWFSRGTTLE